MGNGILAKLLRDIQGIGKHIREGFGKRVYCIGLCRTEDVSKHKINAKVNTCLPTKAPPGDNPGATIIKLE